MWGEQVSYIILLPFPHSRTFTCLLVPQSSLLTFIPADTSFYLVLLFHSFSFSLSFVFFSFFSSLPQPQEHLAASKQSAKVHTGGSSNALRSKLYLSPACLASISSSGTVAWFIVIINDGHQHPSGSWVLVGRYKFSSLLLFSLFAHVYLSSSALQEKCNSNRGLS